MGLISNLPSINDQLLAQTRHEELVRLIGDVERRILDRLERRMTVNEHNSMARNLNTMVLRANGRLSPPKTSNNEDVPEFPETLSELHDLNGPQINHLLVTSAP